MLIYKGWTKFHLHYYMVSNNFFNYSSNSSKFAVYATLKVNTFLFDESNIIIEIAWWRYYVVVAAVYTMDIDVGKSVVKHLASDVGVPGLIPDPPIFSSFS
jgi:hypothetical protein